MDHSTTLTAKQSAFCAFIAEGDNQTEAYIKSHDVKKQSRKASANEGSKLMRMEKVRSRVSELKEQRQKAKETHRKISKDWILDKLRTEASDDENNASVRVRALEILAKTEKLFDDSTSVNIVHRSSDEIYKELQEALSGFDLDMN